MNKINKYLILITVVVFCFADYVANAQCSNRRVVRSNCSSQKTSCGTASTQPARTTTNIQQNNSSTATMSIEELKKTATRTVDDLKKTETKSGTSSEKIISLSIEALFNEMNLVRQNPQVYVKIFEEMLAADLKKYSVKSHPSIKKRHQSAIE